MLKLIPLVFTFSIYFLICAAKFRHDFPIFPTTLKSYTEAPPSSNDTSTPMSRLNLLLQLDNVLFSNENRLRHWRNEKKIKQIKDWIQNVENNYEKWGAVAEQKLREWQAEKNPWSKELESKSIEFNSADLKSEENDEEEKTEDETETEDGMKKEKSEEDNLYQRYIKWKKSKKGQKKDPFGET